MGSTADDEYEQLLFPDIMRRQTARLLLVPMQNPPLLPLADLEPEVLERLAAEVVSRSEGTSTVHFYGRRGQKQHGLDIVQWRRGARPTLYQVKRYETINPAQLRKAVVTYAGPARSAGYSGPPRRFDPDRFVVLTSALASVFHQGHERFG